jgi:hypothetical protein
MEASPRPPAPASRTTLDRATVERVDSWMAKEGKSILF